MIAFIEMWYNEYRLDKSSAWQTTHLFTKLDKQIRRGVALFVHNDFDFKKVKGGNIFKDDI